MKYVALFILVGVSLIVALLYSASYRDAQYDLHKTLFITDRGDTIVAYGGTLYHFDNNTYTTSSLTE